MIQEIFDSVQSALALDEVEMAAKILERYQDVRAKFANHGVFDASSWKEFDEKYEDMKSQLEQSKKS
jgi:hypothetical protein